MHLSCCSWKNQEGKHLKSQECTSNQIVFTSISHCHVPLLAEQKKSNIIEWSTASVGYEKSPPDDPLPYLYGIHVNCLLTSCASLITYLWHYDISQLENRGKVISFMSPKSMIIMHVLADMQELFLKKFLRMLDGDNGLIIEFYHVCSNLMKF